MKFQKLELNESLFDADYLGYKAVNKQMNKNIDDIAFDFDDDFSEYDYEGLNEIPDAPKPGLDNGLADTIITLINDEWEAIQGYNNAIDMLASAASEEHHHNAPKMIGILKDIVNEENLHVGQLQELLKLVSPNAKSIEKGQQEGEQQLRFVDGKLPVQSMITQPIQSWDNPSQSNANPNTIDTSCTLCDVDDDM